MNIYRSHNCSELNISNLNHEITLSGWIDTKRDHGNLLFIDLRDNYGITQCVIDSKKSYFNKISSLNNETVIKVSGQVLKRSNETINKSLKTGQIEVDIKNFEVLSSSEILPLPVNSDIEYGEEVRL
jgi:aspartyl-tRNA synthetase